MRCRSCVSQLHRTTQRLCIYPRRVARIGEDVGPPEDSGDLRPPLVCWVSVWLGLLIKRLLLPTRKLTKCATSKRTTGSGSPRRSFSEPELFWVSLSRPISGHCMTHRGVEALAVCYDFVLRRHIEVSGEFEAMLREGGGTFSLQDLAHHYGGSAYMVMGKPLVGIQRYLTPLQNELEREKRQYRVRLERQYGRRTSRKPGKKTKGHRKLPLVPCGY
jgi:hypothetical protein